MAKKKQPELKKTFIDSVKKVALALKKEPNQVTKAEFFANDPNEIKEWDLRKAGGFENLKKMFFAPAPDQADVKHGSRLIASFRNKLEKRFGTESYMQEEILATLEDGLKQNPIRMHPPVKTKVKKDKKKSRTIVAHLSDTHYGANVNPDEVGGVNKFDWTTAARRTALFVDQIVNYKPHYRSETKLVLGINGDIIAGMIHDQEWFADLLTVQFLGALDILTQAVSYLANHFAEVEVYCTSGNHGRAMHKASKDRGTTHKWDSYESMLYLALKKVVEAQHKNVKVSVPRTPFAIIRVYKHLILMTHGDTVVNVGNPGKALNMRDINTQIAKLNASELGGADKFSAVLVGHVHTPTVQLTESGCMMVINGCLSGLDPFAQSIGIFESHPTQQLFEVTEKHAVGDIRLIQLKSADDDQKLDKIIQPKHPKLS